MTSGCGESDVDIVLAVVVVVVQVPRNVSEKPNQNFGSLWRKAPEPNYVLLAGLTLPTTAAPQSMSYLLPSVSKVVLCIIYGPQRERKITTTHGPYPVHIMGSIAIPSSDTDPM